MKSLSFPTKILLFLIIISVLINFSINRDLKSNIIIIIASILFIYNTECLISGNCYTMVWYQIGLYTISVVGYIYYHYITRKEENIPNTYHGIRLPGLKFPKL
jgi:hypothetical protein